MHNNGLLTANNKVRAIAAAQRWYDDRGMAPWALGSDNKKKARGRASVHAVEIVDDTSDDLAINAVSKTLKCRACGELGHEIRNCLTSSNMSNIKPKTTTVRAPDKPKTEKKCTWCNKPRHEQPECYDWLKVMNQILEARKAKQSNPQQPTGSNRQERGRGRGSNRG